MKPIRFAKAFVVSQWYFLVVFLLSSCTPPTNPVMYPTLSSPAVVITEQKSTETLSPPQQPLPDFTVTPNSADGRSTPEITKTLLLPSATPIKPAAITKKILLLVDEEVNSDFARNSLWILSPESDMPLNLLQDKTKSFEYPTWSHDGEWISFIQSDWPFPGNEQIGIIHEDGTGKRIFGNKYGPVGDLNWSANDTWLVFATLSQALALNINTGEIVDLEPESDTDSKNYDIDRRVEPSPRENLVAYAKFNRYPSTDDVDMWLLSLDSKEREKIQLPTEIPSQCRQSLNNLDWSPDGEAILVQFKGWPWGECEAKLWLYKLSERKWINIARIPDSLSGLNPSYDQFSSVSWSPDGRWIAWENYPTALIYDVENDWRFTREIEFGVADGFSLWPPWVEDTAGNYIYTLVRFDYSQIHTDEQVAPITIIGISPNGTTNDDNQLLRIEPNPKWLLKDWTFSPRVWEP